jgi:hypothetical protein
LKNIKFQDNKMIGINTSLLPAINVVETCSKAASHPVTKYAVGAIATAAIIYGGYQAYNTEFAASLISQASEKITNTFGTVIEEGYCTETHLVDNTWGLGLFGQVDTITNKLPFGSQGDGLECIAPVKSFQATVLNGLNSFHQFFQIA